MSPWILRSERETTKGRASDETLAASANGEAQ